MKKLITLLLYLISSVLCVHLKASHIYCKHFFIRAMITLTYTKKIHPPVCLCNWEWKLLVGGTYCKDNKLLSKKKCLPCKRG